MRIDELVPVSEAARELGLSLWTLHKWAREGRLGARKLENGHWRFSRRELEQFKQGQEVR